MYGRVLCGVLRDGGHPHCKPKGTSPLFLCASCELSHPLRPQSAPK